MKKTLSLMIILCMLLLILPLQAAAFADTITLPDALRTIEAEAFMNDTSLETVVIPSTVTSIGSKAFAGSSATAVFISSSEITIEGDAFDQTATLYVSSDAAYNAAYGRFTYRDLRNTNFLMMTPHSNENDNIINGTRNDKAYMDFTATVRDGININTTEIQVLVSKNGNFDGTQGQDWWEIPPRAYSTETQEYRLAPSLTTYLKGILLDSSGNQLAESGVVQITTQDKDKDTDCPYYQHELVLNNGTVTADLIGPPYFWLETTENGVYQFVTSGVENISITNQDGKFICSADKHGLDSPYAGVAGSGVSNFSIPVDGGTSSLYLNVKREENTTASLTVTKESAVIPTNTLTMTPHSDENDHIINGTRNDTAYMDFTATVADGINIDETEIQVLVSLNENFEDYWKTLPHAYSTETQEYRLAPSLTAYLKGRLLDSNGTPLAESDAVKITTEDKTGADCPYNWKDKNGENHHKLVLNNGTVTADLIGPPYFWFETTGNGVYQFVASGVDDISITNQDGKFICRAYENGIDSPYDDAAGDIVSGFSIPIDGGTSSLYLRVKYKENTTASLTVTKEGAVIPTNTLTMTPHSDASTINGIRNDKAYMDFTATVANGININTTEVQVLVSLNKNFEGTQGRDWWETPSRPYSPETQEYRLAPSLTAYLKGILLDSEGNQLAESGVVEIRTADKNGADSPYNWSENGANHHKLVLNNGTVTADLIGPPYFWFETTGNGVYRFVTSGVASISITNQDGKFICSANESGINSPYAGTEGSNVSSFSIPVDDGTSSLYLEVRKANNTASLTITKRS